MVPTAKIKRVLGELPIIAELDWAVRGNRAPMDGFKLEEIRNLVPDWVEQVEKSPLLGQKGKKVLVFATLHYWISHAMLLSLALAATGNQITPRVFALFELEKEISKFDLRRREAYTRSVFKPAERIMKLVSFAQGRTAERLPDLLFDAIRQVAIMDTQYTLQVEEVDQNSELFQLRLQRDQEAAAATIAWVKTEKPNSVVLPNGLILEFGAVFQTVQYLNIPVVSYEFGEQRGRIWLSRNTPVMLQETNSFWEQKKNEFFNEEQRVQVEELFTSRQAAGLFRHFYRRWQDIPAEGTAAVRSKLNLDSRPLVLLAANVVGDSLTLGRAAFTEDMSTWLRRTLAYFAKRDDVQFVLRVHPGERNLDGPSVADLVRDEFPRLPAHMHVVAAADPVNTYDLVTTADLGLVYTTTVGLEMAMSGLPVIVAGHTHYRGKGFTFDPTSWESYFALLEEALADLSAQRLSKEIIDKAWHYAYSFFFDYPQPFPWHLLHFANDLELTSLADLFSEEGQEKFGPTFSYLLGEPFDWDAN